MLPEANCVIGLSGFMKSPATEINGIDWMAQQNGGQFDPVLFGDYRDSQDNILNSASLGDFFNDAFPVQDFGTPYFTNDPVSKKEPMKEIKTAQKDSPSQLTPAVDKEKFLTCDKIWYVAHILMEGFKLTLWFTGNACKRPRNPMMKKSTWTSCVPSLNSRPSAQVKVLSLPRKTLMRYWVQCPRGRTISSRCLCDLLLVGGLNSHERRGYDMKTGVNL